MSRGDAVPPARASAQATKFLRSVRQGVLEARSRASRLAAATLAKPREAEAGSGSAVATPPLWSRQAREVGNVVALRSLGFSTVAALHALERCNGQREAAAAWLLDEANADELLAVTLNADEADGELGPGCTAKIVGFRRVRHFNGMRVLVLAWEDGSRRWVVEAPDGSRKAIRPQNLERMDDPALSPPPTLAAKEEACDEGASCMPLQRPGSPVQATGTVVKNAGTTSVVGATDVPGATDVAGTVGIFDSSDGHAGRTAQADDCGTTGADASDGRAVCTAQAELNPAAERQAASESSGGGFEEQRAELQRLQGEGDRAAQAGLNLSERQAGAESSRDGLEEQRAELQRLQAEAERAAQDLEEQRELTKRSAEDRELMLLEREGEQLRVAEYLREEQALLERQRRSTLALQGQALRSLDTCEGGCLHVPLTLDDTFVDEDDVRLDDEVWDLDWCRLSRNEDAQVAAPEDSGNVAENLSKDAEAFEDVEKESIQVEAKFDKDMQAIEDPASKAAPIAASAA